MPESIEVRRAKQAAAKRRLRANRMRAREVHGITRRQAEALNNSELEIFLRRRQQEADAAAATATATAAVRADQAPAHATLQRQTRDGKAGVQCSLIVRPAPVQALATPAVGQREEDAAYRAILDTIDRNRTRPLSSDPRNVRARAKRAAARSAAREAVVAAAAPAQEGKVVDSEEEEEEEKDEAKEEEEEAKDEEYDWSQWRVRLSHALPGLEERHFFNRISLERTRLLEAGELDAIATPRELMTHFEAEVSALLSGSAQRVQVVSHVQIVDKEGNEKAVEHNTTTVSVNGWDDLMKSAYEGPEGFFAEHVEGSGWMLCGWRSLAVTFYADSRLQGSSYIPVPALRRKGVVNVENNDEQCFKWAVLSALFPARDGDDCRRLSHYRRHENTERVSFEGLTYPVKVKDIDAFERRNPHVGVHVFGYDLKKDKVRNHTILRATKNTGAETIIPLVLIEDKAGKKFHFAWVKDLSAFCTDRTHHGKRHWCLRCLSYFSSAENLAFHKECGCDNVEAVKTVTPPVGTVIKFKNYKAMLEKPFVWYCDFEAVLEGLTVERKYQFRTEEEEEDAKETTNSCNHEHGHNDGHDHSHVHDRDQFFRALSRVRKEPALAQPAKVSELRAKAGLEEGCPVRLHDTQRILEALGDTRTEVVVEQATELEAYADLDAQHPTNSGAKRYLLYKRGQFLPVLGLSATTVRLSEQRAFSWCLVRVCRQRPEWNTVEYKTTTVDDCIRSYLKACERSHEDAMGKLRVPAEMVMSEAQREAHEGCSQCWICEKSIPAEYSGEAMAELVGRLEAHAQTKEAVEARWKQESPAAARNVAEYAQQRLERARQTKVFDQEYFQWWRASKDMASAKAELGSRASAKKVADHCHLTGQFRGTAHSGCNLQLSIKPQTLRCPFYFHNLRGYDANHILQKLHRPGARMSCIGHNLNKLMTFGYQTIQFRDTTQHLSASLASLVADLRGQCPLTRSMLQGPQYRLAEPQVELLLRKGVFPYEWLDDLKKLDEPGLPPQAAFASVLSGAISDDEYAHALRVWKGLGCRTMRDYHDWYLLTDTLLLADVFETYRTTILETPEYRLDPANFLSAPGLAWDSMLKFSGQTIRPLHDVDMHLWLENKALRGGNAMIGSLRHARANDRRSAAYDPKFAGSSLLYVDANGLYAEQMLQHVPYHVLGWGDAKDWTLDRVLALPPDGDEGCFVEVDLEYPAELHDLHASLPLAPVRRAVSASEYSPLTQRLRRAAEGLDGGGGGGGEKELRDDGAEKLICDLHDKKGYVCHYRNLQLYVALGLRVTSLHRTLVFKQSDFMRRFVEFNIAQRIRYKGHPFKSDLYKLFNNSTFGRSMMNKRKQGCIQLVSSARRMEKILYRQRSYLDHRIVNEHLCLVRVRRQKLVLDQPIFIGAALLELSKRHMYDFHYNAVLPLYDNDPARVRLCMTDTDSLLYHLVTEDLCADLARIRDRLDTGNFPTDHPLYDAASSGLSGRFKSETGTVAIDEFVGLLPKMYALRIDEAMSAKDRAKKSFRAKGVPGVARRALTFDQYKSIIDDGARVHYCSAPAIRADRQHLYTVVQRKKALSGVDTKRYVADNNVDTLPYGHVRIAGQT